VFGRRDAVPVSADSPELLDIPDEGPRSIEYIVGRPVFSIPSRRLRYLGGIPFSPENHHFLRYYRNGLQSLRAYYHEHQPRDILERHFLRTAKGRRVPDRWGPWLVEANDRWLPGEGGLGPEHGIQAFGPVSEEKLHLEASRLDRVLESISERGFRPEMGGFPRGYFLMDEDGDWVVIVRVGYHRVSAMVHLGFPTIPLQFHPDYPRVVRRKTWPDWPLVKDGSLTRDEALNVFDQYFNEVSPPGVRGRG